jgi:hypothetical protein
MLERMIGVGKSESHVTIAPPKGGQLARGGASRDTEVALGAGFRQSTVTVFGLMLLFWKTDRNTPDLDIDDFSRE